MDQAEFGVRGQGDGQLLAGGEQVSHRGARLPDDASQHGAQRGPRHGQDQEGHQTQQWLSEAALDAGELSQPGCVSQYCYNALR